MRNKAKSRTMKYEMSSKTQNDHSETQNIYKETLGGFKETKDGIHKKHKITTTGICMVFLSQCGGGFWIQEHCDETVSGETIVLEDVACSADELFFILQRVSVIMRSMSCSTCSKPCRTPAS